MRHFTNIKNYKDLKEQYKKLIKVNHPDAGGDTETMQEINNEYDVLFAIWKNKAEKAEELTEDEKTETARSTRRTFYTAYGWEGSRYDRNLSLKEIAKIVRAYVKEKYPLCKFSIRTHYASMCQSLSIDLLEFPEPMYKMPEDFTSYADLSYTVTCEDGTTYETFTDEAEKLFNKLIHNNYISGSTSFEEWQAAYKKAFENSPSFYGIQTEYFKSVIDDVEAFTASYNYDDSDGQIDYFDVNFYGGDVNISSCKYVPKVARIKNETKTPTKAKEPEQAQLEKGEKPYTITESKHTKTNETIYLVKWLPTLSRSEYIELSNKIKSIGGYYSKFTHSFVFKSNPAEELAKIA